MVEQTSCINYDKLEAEIYSVIAHAAAGSDMEAADIEMAAKGCIEEVKKAIGEK